MPHRYSRDGFLLYISNYVSYKPRSDLSIHKCTELESAFIEFLKPKKINVILNCIYQHPHTELNEFNAYYVNKLFV